MYSYEKKVLLVSTNSSTFDNMNLCLNSYSSQFGLKLIVEKFSFFFVYSIDKIYEKRSNLIVITIMIILIYAGLNPRSGAANTLREILHITRADILTVFHEFPRHIIRLYG